MSLADSTMLISLNIRAWTARKYDHQVTEEVETNHKAKDAGRWNKILISREATGRLQKIAGEARVYHYKNTLPWFDDGGRLLPANNYFNYVTEIRKFKDKYDKEIYEFVNEYLELKEEAKLRLSDTYKESDYPPMVEVEKKYSFEIKILPVPTAEDFRVNINDEEVELIKGKIEDQIKGATEAAMNDLWTRLFKVVNHMAERLSDKKNKFKNTLVTNIADICDILPGLNITGDPNLDESLREVKEKLSGYDPRNLRNNTDLRESVADDAKKILDKMRPYMAAHRG